MHVYKQDIKIVAYTFSILVFVNRRWWPITHILHSIAVEYNRLQGQGGIFRIYQGTQRDNHRQGQQNTRQNSALTSAWPCLLGSSIDVPALQIIIGTCMLFQIHIRHLPAWVREMSHSEHKTFTSFGKQWNMEWHFNNYLFQQVQPHRYNPKF